MQYLSFRGVVMHTDIYFHNTPYAYHLAIKKNRDQGGTYSETLILLISYCSLCKELDETMFITYSNCVGSKAGESWFSAIT